MPYRTIRHTEQYAIQNNVLYRTMSYRTICHIQNNMPYRTICHTEQYTIKKNMLYRTICHTKQYAIQNNMSYNFFLSTIIEWQKLDWNIKNSGSIKLFKKLLSWLRPGLSHLREHSFQDSLNPFCSCGKGEVETSSIFSTVPPIRKDDWHSWTIQKILTCLFYNKVIWNLVVFSFSTKLLLTITKIILSLMPL